MAHPVVDQLAQLGAEVDGGANLPFNSILGLLTKFMHEQQAAMGRMAERQERCARQVEGLAADVKRLEQKQQQGGVVAAPSGSGRDADIAALADRVEQQGMLIKQLMSGGVLIVDRDGAGSFLDIPSALAVAKNGDTIIVRPGVYPEALVFDVSGVVIKGTGPSNTDTRIEHGAETCATLFRADVLLSHMSIHSVGPHNCAVRVDGGNPKLQGCRISSQNLSCVVIVNGAPVFENCEIYGSKQHGVCCKSGTTPVLKNCDIHHNHQPNVVVERGARPTISKCTIHASSQNGVWFRTGSAGTLTQCTINDNMYSNIDIAEEADPVVTENKIFGSSKCGVCVADRGKGTISRNEIYGNAYSNVGMMSHSQPEIADNKIHGSRQHGLLIKAGAGGRVAGNSLYNNALANIKLEPGATTQVSDNTR
eukprot:TRINITY_DN25738_c0_g1_i1.p1 TRINITY_DN25738_c0_g1~~TRINITY_DN25738_c0_g1_i1.p1  ORF type:complete len:449 (+),score=159.75 TRINITY_DN25738_c0_g1_i1:82-1347(+)